MVIKCQTYLENFSVELVSPELKTQLLIYDYVLLTITSCTLANKFALAPQAASYPWNTKELIL